MRSWRSELLTVSMVLSVPVTLAVAFPHAAFGFRARSVEPRRGAFAAFVRLSADEERAALAAVKSTWRNAGAFAGDRFGTLPLGVLPSEVHSARPLLTIADRADGRQPELVGFEPPPFLPSAAAAPPETLASDTKKPEPATFSREDMLKID